MNFPYCLEKGKPYFTTFVDRWEKINQDIKFKKYNTIWTK